jgi:hypothetical protein
VWGAYNPSGQLTGTFCAPEDPSLTDAKDETFAVPDNCSVGVVHPLELSPEARQAWLRSLADYDIVTPFAHMERPVVIVKQHEAATKFGSAVAETELNDLTHKGRAERLGWARGSVCDAGCVNYYLKSFPAAGVDAFVESEGTVCASVSSICSFSWQADLAKPSLNAGPIFAVHFSHPRCQDLRSEFADGRGTAGAFAASASHS